MTFTSAFLRVCLCFSLGCISLHAALPLFLCIRFCSLRFGALNEFVCVSFPYLVPLSKVIILFLFTWHSSVALTCLYEILTIISYFLS